MRAILRWRRKRKHWFGSDLQIGTVVLFQTLSFFFSSTKVIGSHPFLSINKKRKKESHSVDGIIPSGNYLWSPSTDFLFFFLLILERKERWAWTWFSFIFLHLLIKWKKKNKKENHSSLRPIFRKRIIVWAHRELNFICCSRSSRSNECWFSFSFLWFIFKMRP